MDVAIYINLRDYYVIRVLEDGLLRFARNDQEGVHSRREKVNRIYLDVKRGGIDCIYLLVTNLIKKHLIRR